MELDVDSELFIGMVFTVVEMKILGRILALIKFL